MNALPITVHVLVALSVVAFCTTVLRKPVVSAYRYFEVSYPNFFLGSVNIINLIYFMVIFILIPKAIAHVIIYLIAHQVFLDGRYASYTSVLYVAAFALSTYILKLFPFNVKSNA